MPPKPQGGLSTLTLNSTPEGPSTPRAQEAGLPRPRSRRQPQLGSYPGQLARCCPLACHTPLLLVTMPQCHRGGASLELSSPQHLGAQEGTGSVSRCSPRARLAPGFLGWSGRRGGEFKEPKAHGVADAHRPRHSPGETRISKAPLDHGVLASGCRHTQLRLCACERKSAREAFHDGMKNNGTGENHQTTWGQDLQPRKYGLPPWR